MKLAFIDTETTGLDPQTSAVIEFAAIIVCEDGLLAQVGSKIKPTEAEMERAHPKALEVNGYTPEAWANAPSMSEFGPLIVNALRGSTLVGHNVSFDESMIKASLSRHGVEGRIPYHKIDTVTLVYEHLFPLGLRRASLDSVRDFLGWSRENAHTAMKDAEDVKKLFDLLWRMTPEQQTDLARQLAG